MALRDRYDNPISTTIPAARDAYDTGIKQLLSSNFGALDAFEAAVTADPGFALGHAARARALMFAGDMAKARDALATAEKLATDATHRERQHVATLARLASGPVTEARRLAEDHVTAFPRDVLIAQLCTSVFGLIAFSGDMGHEAAMLAYTARLLPHYDDDWWMNCVHAVSLCETGQIDASLTLMDRSLAQFPRNANAAHFRSHALYEAGDTDGGLAYLDDWMRDYDDRAILHGHLCWHQALWALHAGDTAAMWRAVDGGVAPGASKGAALNILTDTAAILYRAEIAGIDVAPERWQMLSDYATRFFPKTGQSFADIHAALSHAMAGNGDALAHIAEAAGGYAGDLVRPVAQAFGAMARGDWQGAVRDLAPTLTGAERFGGSRAQRDLLELSYVHALLKLGQTEEARRSLTIRRPVLTAKPPVAGLQ